MLFKCDLKSTYARFHVLVWVKTDEWQHLLISLQGLGLHNHEDDGHDHSHDEGIVVEEFVWKTFLACIVIWGFFNLQLMLQALLKNSKSDVSV